MEKKEILKAPLVEAMLKYKKKPKTGFHIPGHNRGNILFDKFSELISDNPMKVDTTDEFDNLGTLNPATGKIKEALIEAAKTFGAQKSFFLTGGSTIGNLAIAFGITKNDDEIIIGRNCHRSVLAGMIISGATPRWIVPKKLDNWAIFGNIDPIELEIQLKNCPNSKLVWITNPTYEGVVSDIEAISAICKKYNVPLIVDEAHGCLWKFNDKLPKSALDSGADAVIHSLHKTGGSMTQTSILHIGKNSKIDIDKIEQSLKLLHTTSPSMLLLSSLDAARANLVSKKGQKAIENAINNAVYFREKVKNIENIKVLDSKSKIDFDVTKIFLKVGKLSGEALQTILRDDFNIEIESASDEGILILSNIGGKKSEFDKLVNALKIIAKKKYNDPARESGIKIMPLIDPEIVLNPRDAYFAAKEKVKKENAIGRISSDVIALCPPGISILLPGEVITQKHLPYLFNYKELEVVKLTPTQVN